MLRCVVLCNLCCIEVLVRFQDDLWKESLNVLKLAVASSSQLEVPTRKTLSVAYDSTWSLDTTPVRQELPGKTLSFSFDLSSAGSQDVQEFPQKTQLETIGWKRPQSSQVRIYSALLYTMAE